MEGVTGNKSELPWDSKCQLHKYKSNQNSFSGIEKVETLSAYQSVDALFPVGKHVSRSFVPKETFVIAYHLDFSPLLMLQNKFEGSS